MVNFPIALNYKKFKSSKIEDTPDKDKYEEYGGFNMASGTKTFNFIDEIYNIFIVRCPIPSMYKNERMRPGNMNCPNDQKTVPAIFASHPIYRNKIYENRYNIEMEQHSNRDKGKNYFWGSWFANIARDYIFIGKIKDDSVVEIKEIDSLNIELSDTRLLYLFSEKDINKQDYHVYMTSPRGHMSSLKHMLIIVYINSENKLDYKQLIIPITQNLEQCISNNDINMPCYDIKFNNINDNDIELTLYYFIWIVEKCITKFSYKIIIPSHICIINNIIPNPNYIYRSSYTLNQQLCIKYICPKENLLTIDNDYFIGPENSPNAYNDQTAEYKSLGLSWGSPFVKVNELHDNELLLSVAHLKLSTANIVYVYDTDSKLLIVREKLRNVLKNLFGAKYKINYSGFNSPCIEGFHYFSVFLLFNIKTNKMHMSNAFIPINRNDRYHFSLIFSVGLFNVGEHTYITSGEGDYNCSIIKFNTKSIIDSCVHDVLDRNYNINNVKFYLQFQNPAINIILDDTMADNINHLVPNIISSGGGFIKNKKNKYINNKNKYLQLKKNSKIELKPQIGGLYKTIYSSNRVIELKDRDDALNLEMKVNISENMTRERKLVIGDFLFYTKGDNISVTENEMDVLVNLHQSPQPDDRMSPVSQSQQPITQNDNINEDEIKVIDDLDTDKLLKLIGLNIGYNGNNKYWFDQRIKDIREYFSSSNKKDLDKFVLDVFNNEKINSHESKKKLDEKLLENNIKLVFAQNYRPTGFKNRSKMGIYVDDDGKTYIYKELQKFNKTLDLTNFPENILKCYEFIENCQIAYFLETTESSTIEFIKIEKKLIICNNDNKNISIGYLMEKLEGDTVRDFKKNNTEYYETTIKPTILRLIDKLTAINFLIDDFALDNVMWDNKIKKLTYIDISPHSFGKNKVEVYDNNLYVYDNVSINHQIY